MSPLTQGLNYRSACDGKIKCAKMQDYPRYANNYRQTDVPVSKQIKLRALSFRGFLRATA